MPDEIERIIRRDLDLLPVLPRERWLPAAPGTSSRIRTGLFPAVAGFVVIALVLAFGTDLRQIYMEVGNEAASAAPGLSQVFPDPRLVSRQAVLARISQLTADLPRIDRIEAKLTDVEALRASGGPYIPSPAAGATSPPKVWWVVAVSGDVRCSYCLAPSGPFHSAIYLVDAYRGDVQSMSARSDFWPAGYDELSDRTVWASPTTTTVIVQEVRLPDTILVATVGPAGQYAAGTRLTLYADENTAFAWSAGDVGGTAITLEDLVRSGHLMPGSSVLTSVSFEDAPRVDGSLRLERVITGVYTR